MQVERPQGPDAADAEDDLLAEPVLLVTAVQPVGDGDRLGRVPGDVRVEQVQADAPDVDAPHPDLHFHVGEIDDDLHPVGCAPSAGGSMRAFVSSCQPSALRC